MQPKNMLSWSFSPQILVSEVFLYLEAAPDREML